MASRTRRPILERLISKIHKDPTTECWEWQGTIDPKGYGRLHIDSIGRPAHRISYLIHKGEIPAGMLVCHTCDNRRCVNPDHLFIGTNMDNMADMVAKGRQNKCRGEKHGKARLSASTVLAIRATDNGMTHGQIAERFGATKTQVADIKSGRSWKYLEAGNG